MIEIKDLNTVEGFKMIEIKNTETVGGGSHYWSG